MRYVILSGLVSLVAAFLMCFLMMPQPEASEAPGTESAEMGDLRDTVAGLREEISRLDERMILIGSEAAESAARPAPDASNETLVVQREDDDAESIPDTLARQHEALEVVQLRLDDLERRLRTIEEVLRYGENSDLARKPPAGENNGKPSWGVEQVLGPPDTATAGDHSTAWASATQDGQDEWLLLTFASSIRATAVEIHENHCPGAVFRIEGVLANGEETLLWEGADPTSSDDPKGVSVIPIRGDARLHQIRVHLASMRVPGWNEIDAVALVDKKRNRYWTVGAQASSSYAQRSEAGVVSEFLFGNIQR